jgi:hypothetical protein
VEPQYISLALAGDNQNTLLLVWNCDQSFYRDFATFLESHGENSTAVSRELFRDELNCVIYEGSSEPFQSRSVVDHLVRFSFDYWKRLSSSFSYTALSGNDKLYLLIEGREIARVDGRN